MTASLLFCGLLRSGEFSDFVVGLQQRFVLGLVLLLLLVEREVVVIVELLQLTVLVLLTLLLLRDLPTNANTFV